jgi:TRAP-type mannitol/chloroaromatic compound transport system substrate-binding protein
MKSKATAAAVAAFTTLALTAGLATAEAQTPTRWRMHTAYNKALPVAGQTAFQVAESVKEMSDGKFDIRVFEPGAIVAGAQYYDAVSKGAVNAAYGSPGFNAGKNSAYSFFAAIPFGPGAGEMLAWMYKGGGLELAREFYAKDNIYMMPCGILPPESAGWFRKEITSLDDLKGIKMRFLGLGAKVMERFGVSTQLMAPGEVYQALELGTLDAAEQSVPAIDRGLGFYRVAKFNYFPGWHQQSTIQELLVNLDSWNKLSDGQRRMVEAACHEATVMQLADGEAGQAAIIKQNEADGVKTMTWPDEFLAAFRKEWENVIAEETRANPDSKRVWDSLQAFRTEYAVWGERGYLKPGQ